MVKKIIVLCLLAGCAHTPEQQPIIELQVDDTKIERFKKCRGLFYTNYPEEIKQEEWHNCMQGKDNG
jgi:hypothetical protein|tara:strand:- start:74 stop:274 length:201 start_codon:yes stop_codon:yes gene_type:complete